MRGNAYTRSNRAAINDTMTLLKIARMGHPILLGRADEIADPTARDVGQLVDDMIETMDDAGGVGLAAPQVHVGRRVIIFKAPQERGGDDGEATETVGLTTLINPTFEPLGEDTALGWEGCLSVPGLSGAVPRYLRIRYSGFSPQGEHIECEATGFHARVVQHEIDHLDGMLYTMRMTDLSLLAFSEELRHFRRANDAGVADETDEVA